MDEKKTKKNFAIASWAIDNRMTVFVIMAILLIGGVMAYSAMPRESFPEVIESKIYVSSIYPCNSAEDVEKLITKEIEEKKAGSFTQVPLKWAWAITIHKSQGLTFEKAIIDAGSSFAHGQTYVALSRCKTLEGIVLKTEITILYVSHRMEPRLLPKTIFKLTPSKEGSIGEILER